jgi:hypothetical protein
MTRNWVAALDLIYEHDGSTRIVGRQPGTDAGMVDIHAQSGTSQSFALAPAIEYNWTGNIGVIVGAKVVTSGRNTAAVVIPVAAVNMVF